MAVGNVIGPCPRVRVELSQTHTVPSLLPVTSVRLSGHKARLQTSSRCPRSVARGCEMVSGFRNGRRPVRALSPIELDKPVDAKGR
jgi:hypothetical protein